MDVPPVCLFLVVILCCLVELQNLTRLQLGTLLQVVQLHDGINCGSAMTGNRVECLTLLYLMEARLLCIRGSRCCCSQFHFLAPVVRTEALHLRRHADG